MKINKNLIFVILTLLLVSGTGFFVFAQSITGTNSNLISNTNNENVQIVNMHVKGGQYILEPNNVKKGIPVRIKADISRMPGCSKSIVIPGFNIKKFISEDDNIIDFTPDKSGTFNVACSMNMYTGKLIVLDSNGEKSNYVEQASAKQMTCGASESGTGCGCRG